MVELSQLDLRYEGCRLKSPAAEARLLAAIAQSGIQQPLQGVELTAARILLNGFKRLYKNRLTAGTGSVHYSLHAPFVLGLHRNHEALTANRDHLFLEGIAFP